MCGIGRIVIQSNWARLVGNYHVANDENTSHEATLTLKDVLIALTDAVHGARRKSAQKAELQLRRDYLHEDGSPKTQLIQTALADGSWETLPVPLILLFPPKPVQIQQVTLDFQAWLVGTDRVPGDSKNPLDLELALQSPSNVAGAPSRVEVCLRGDSLAVRVDGEAVAPEPAASGVAALDRATLERELRMVAIDFVGGFASSTGPALLVSSRTHVYYARKPTKKSWRYSEAPKDKATLSPETVRDFEEANEEPLNLAPTDFAADSPFKVELIEPAGFQGLAEANRVELLNLRKHYPQSYSRIIELSRFGWAPDDSECLLYVGWITPNANGRGRFIVFRRHGSQYACGLLPFAPSWNK